MQSLITVVYVENLAYSTSPFNKMKTSNHETMEGAIKRAKEHLETARKRMTTINDLPEEEIQVTEDGFFFEEYGTSNWIMCEIIRRNVEK